MVDASKIVEYLQISARAIEQNRLDEFHDILVNQDAERLEEFVFSLALKGYEGQFPGVTCPVCESKSVTDLDEGLIDALRSDGIDVDDDSTLACVECQHSWNDPDVDVIIDNTWRETPEGMN